MRPAAVVAALVLAVVLPACEDWGPQVGAIEQTQKLQPQDYGGCPDPIEYCADIGGENTGYCLYGDLFVGCSGAMVTVRVPNDQGPYPTDLFVEHATGTMELAGLYQCNITDGPDATILHIRDGEPTFCMARLKDAVPGSTVRYDEHFVSNPVCLGWLECKFRR